MIYENEYGTVEIFSDEFMNGLDVSKQNVGVKLSGGTDTALLLYLMAKEISEKGLNFHLKPYTINDAPKRNEVADEIINVVRKDFPTVKIDNTIHSEFGNTLKKRQQWVLYTQMFVDDFNVAFFSNAVNIEPPEDVKKDRNIRTLPKKAIRYMTDFTEYGLSKDIIEYTPFWHVDKRWIAKTYEELDLMEKLYPLTRSCLGESDVTDNHTKPCQKCFWCMEKYWAFGQYDSYK